MCSLYNSIDWVEDKIYIDYHRLFIKWSSCYFSHCHSKFICSVFYIWNFCIRNFQLQFEYLSILCSLFRRKNKNGITSYLSSFLFISLFSLSHIRYDFSKMAAHPYLFLCNSMHYLFAFILLFGQNQYHV